MGRDTAQHVGVKASGVGGTSTGVCGNSIQRCTREMFTLVGESANPLAPPINKDSANVEADDKSWQIRECDIIMMRQLGEGAFGSVWEGRLRPDGRTVAIKILYAKIVEDEDGHVDERMKEDFRLECFALQRLDSPHLIKFFGFGTSEQGNGFIVTELMCGGCLENVRAAL